MSAFLVSEKHIATMVWNMREQVGEKDFAFHAKHILGIRAEGDELLVAVANALWKENNRSVNYRYNERSKAPVMKHFPKVDQVNIAQLNSLIHCWEYQSCEPDNYTRTKSYVFVGKIKSELLDGLVKYSFPTDHELAKWSI